jgi:hypothetical protein
MDHHVCDHTCNHGPIRLDELGYRDIIGEIIPNSVAGARNNKLPFRDWAPLLKSVKFSAARRDTMKFFVANNHNGWENYIRFDDWDDVVRDRSLTSVEAARLLLWSGNIRLHCNCPSFTFWGFNYILTQLDAAIVDQPIFPKTRNKDLKGIACKHLIRTLKVLPFHLGDMARVITQQRQRLVSGQPEPPFEG